MTPRENPLLEGRVIKRVSLESIKGSCATHETETMDRLELLKLFRRENAAAFVGAIAPGFHRFGFTKGQFSLVDVIKAVIPQIGPCEFALSTWTVAQADLTELQSLLSAANFTRIRFLLDMSFQRRQPQLIGHIRKTFGEESVRVTKNHAKFLLFKTDAYKIVCRTSMNLNFNPRFEDIELKDDARIHDFIDGILSDIFTAHDAKAQIEKTVSALSSEFKGLAPGD